MKVGEKLVGKLEQIVELYQKPFSGKLISINADATHSKSEQIGGDLLLSTENLAENPKKWR